MGDVVDIKTSTTLDIPVEKVLDGVRDCSEVIVIGVDENGEPRYASSISDAYRILWMVEKFKEQLLHMEKV